MAHTRPVQVFTDLKSSDKHNNFRVVPDSNVKMDEVGIKEATTLNSGTGQITVSGVGEMVLPPDMFALTIKCKASKDNIQDAKASVTRRVDYIVQTLKNYSLTDEQFKMYSHAGHADTHATFETEIEAHFSDVNKCLSVSNILTEKLGPGVNISLPVCYHAQGSLDRLRKQAGMLAIYNARQKALEMSKIIHLTVGSALQVQELESEMSNLSSSSDVDTFDLSPSIQQKLAEKTVKISSKVNVCFQLKSAKPKKL